jgi:hypothetical protein
MKGIRRVIIGRIGDVNPIDYGGGVVVRVHQGGKSHLILEHTYGMESEHPEAAGLTDAKERAALLTLYRADIADDVKAHLDWVDWNAVRASSGVNLATIAHDATAKDPVLRALVYELVASHYGWGVIDTGPLVLSNAELRKRWKY